MTTAQPRDPAATTRRQLDDEGPDALRESLLQDPDARAAYDATKEQLEFFNATRALRRRLKLSQQRTAELMGTTQSAISDLESGRVVPNLHTLERYAQALGGRLELGLAGVTHGMGNFEVVNKRITGSILMNLWTDYARTVSDVASATTWPVDMLEPILSRLKERGWATTTTTNDQTAYSLNKSAGRIIGLYLRRDRVTAVLQNLDSEVSDTRTAVPVDGSRKTILSLAADLIHDLLVIPLQGVLVGVGVAVAGPVNVDSGTLQFGPDLQSEDDPWRNVQLQTLLRDELRARGHDVPIVVENDANATAVREYQRQFGKYIVSILLSGGGVGVGAVRQSKGIAEVYHGAHFRAGEGGHTTVDPRGPECRAGFPHRGCLETVASAQGALLRLGIAANTNEEIERGLDKVNQRIADGDSHAKKVFRTAGLYFGRFLAATQAFHDPDLIVVTAHRQLVLASPCGDAFRAGVNKALDQAALGIDSGATQVPRIVWDTIERDTYAVAAGAAAWRYFLSHPDAAGMAPSAMLEATGTIVAAAGPTPRKSGMA